MTFSLTKDQVSVVSNINDDLAGSAAMARLLQGDVGSGKTLVSFFACLKVIGDGGQCAILAPTELLARQHAENAARILEPIGVRLAFLTGNVKAGGRARLLGELAGGRIDLVIGTHALFSGGVAYNNLRLVIIDEQHRFGVLQRSAIIEKGTESNPERKNAAHAHDERDADSSNACAFDVRRSRRVGNPHDAAGTEAGDHASRRARQRIEGI